MQPAIRYRVCKALTLDGTIGSFLKYAVDPQPAELKAKGRSSLVPASYTEAFVEMSRAKEQTAAVTQR